MMLTGKSLEFKQFLERRGIIDPYLLHQETNNSWHRVHWRSHFRGFVAELLRNKEMILLLNGRVPFCEGKWDRWWSCMDGVATQKGNKITYHDENREELLYRGNCNRIWFHPEGFVIPIGNNKYLVNGQREIEQESPSHCDGWCFHPEGGYVERRGRDLINRENHKFLRNGKELLYEGAWESWWTLNVGLGIKLEDWFFSAKHDRKELIFHGDYDEWRSSPYGLITRKSGQFLLHHA